MGAILDQHVLFLFHVWHSEQLLWRFMSRSSAHPCEGLSLRCLSGCPTVVLLDAWAWHPCKLMLITIFVRQPSLVISWLEGPSPPSLFSCSSSLPRTPFLQPAHPPTVASFNVHYGVTAAVQHPACSSRTVVLHFLLPPPKGFTRKPLLNCLGVLHRLVN